MSGLIHISIPIDIHWYLYRLVGISWVSVIPILSMKDHIISRSILLLAVEGCNKRKNLLTRFGSKSVSNNTILRTVSFEVLLLFLLLKQISKTYLVCKFLFYFPTLESPLLKYSSYFEYQNFQQSQVPCSFLTRYVQKTTSLRSN